MLKPMFLVCCSKKTSCSVMNDIYEDGSQRRMTRVRVGFLCEKSRGEKRREIAQRKLLSLTQQKLYIQAIEEGKRKYSLKNLLTCPLAMGLCKIILTSQAYNLFSISMGYELSLFSIIHCYYSELLELLFSYKTNKQAVLFLNKLFNLLGQLALFFMETTPLLITGL